MKDEHAMAMKGLECCINSTGYFDPCGGCPFEKHPEGCKAMLRGLADYIRVLEARMPEWISVIELDPPEGEYVLAIGDGQDDVPAIAYIEDGEWMETDPEYFNESVHWRWHSGGMYWMPAPKPPKEDDNR